jgi:glycosyltransferase involved in cell wall biosynthesis
MLFVGGFQHTPNVDAVSYFIHEIMPLLRQRLPGVVFHVAGSNAPEEIMAFACCDVVVHGFVEQIEPLLGSVRINVAPLRFGAGTKGKVVQAMSVGLPTVGTPIAFEGMGFQNEHCIGSSALDIVRKVERLYKDKALWQECAFESVAVAKELYGIDRLDDRIKSLISS